MREGFLFKRGMVFLADFSGVGAIGSEQGTHANGSDLTPVIIIQNDVGNKFSPTVIVAVITSKLTKAKMPTHVELHREIGLEKDSVILCEQLKTIDKQRLKKFCAKVNRDKMAEIDRAMSISLGQVNVREEEVLKQAEEVKYWIRNIDDLIDDIYASNEQIRQRVIRLSVEYNKLKKMCEENRLYVSNYVVINEVKYRNLYKEDKQFAAI